MPFYDYKCEACDTEVTARRHIEDRHDGGDCPTCGRDLKLMITGTLIAPINGAGTGHSGLTKRETAFLRKQYE